MTRTTVKSKTYFCPECDREMEIDDDAELPVRCPLHGEQMFRLPEGLSPGSVIDGRYTVLRPLGEGGMGMVFEAEHQATGQKLAVKLISAVGDDDVAVRRFFREAKASTKIVHPGVIEVYDFGQTAGGRPYMAMEILEGEPLEDLMVRETVLPPARAVRIAAQVASALVASHNHQILHRDLKPANIMIRRDGDRDRVKVLDFGLAKAVEDDTGELGTVTATGMLVGTPLYMSPEQFRSDDLGPATDFYSLGVVLYEMLTGRPPFDGNNIYALMQQHVQEDPDPPREVARGGEIPEEVEQLCMRLLSKEEDQRAEDASALERQLRELAADLGGTELADLEADQQHPPESLEFIKETVAVSGPDTPEPTGKFVAAPTVDSAELQRFRPDLVGRKNTRQLMRRVLDRCADSTTPGVVVLEGPGGVGKSKLLQWYQNRADRIGFQVVRGEHDEGHLGPQAALKEVLEGLLDVRGDGWETIDEQLDELTADGDEQKRLSAGQRDRLRRFLRPEVAESADLGQFEPEDREILFETLLKVMRLAVGETPTLAVMDDLRDDRPFEDVFVDRLAVQMQEADEPLVVVMAVRTEDVDATGAHREPAGDQTAQMSRSVAASLGVQLRDRFHRIEVGPLNDEEIGVLIRRALPGISNEASHKIAELAGGNPLFTLQLLRNMVAEGSLRRDKRGWELHGEPTLPDDLDGVIDARLEALQGREDERDLLIRAALVGQRVPLELLDELLEREGNFGLLDQMDELLDRLIDDGWLRDAESWDEEEVYFEHGFVHRTLCDRYGSRRAARKIHRCLAETLESFYADELEPHARRIADHFLAGRKHARALPYLTRAARGAEARYAMDDAIRIWERAEESLRRARADEETSARVRRGLARTLLYVGRYDDAEEMLDELGDDGKTMELRGDLADARAEYDEAAECYEAAIAEAEALDDREWEGRLRCKSALIYEKCSEYERAIEEAEVALTQGRQLENQKLVGTALNKLAMTNQLSGDLDSSMQYLEREEDIWRELGDDVALGRCLYTRGSLHWRRSEPQEALAAYGEAVPLLENAGHRKGLGHCLRMAGAAAQQLGRLDEALAYCERAYDTFEQIDDPRGLQEIALCFADVHSAREEHDDAILWAERSLERAEALSTAAAQGFSLLTLGEVHLKAGSASLAVDYFESALATQEMETRKHGPAHAHEHLGEALNELGDEERARHHLQQAVELYTEIGNDTAARATQKKLGEL